VLDYAVPGVLTRLDGVGAGVFDGLGGDAVAVCRPVPGLVVRPEDAAPERLGENQLRPAGELVRRLVELDPRPLVEARERDSRVVGTCRHYALLACALLRHRGIPARARVGFATYFQPGQGLDHWVVEHRRDGRWVRLDPEVQRDGLAPGDFLTGGEAWAAYRRGEIDASTYGVYGTENFGPAEIRGNAIRDLAALNKVEMLPWDEWGRMTASYEGRTGPEYDALIDRIAALGPDDDPTALYAEEDLAVPAALLG
jgi:hypothetical protein